MYGGCDTYSGQRPRLAQELGVEARAGAGEGPEAAGISGAPAG